MPDLTLFDLRYEELAARLEGLPAYRVRQIWHGAYRDLAASYDEITTLPLDLRARLAGSLPFPTLVPVEETESREADARKTLFRLHDGETIESVEMLYPDRATVCVSSQVGCPIGCPFCSTGQSGFVRNLRPGEIVEQVLFSSRHLRRQGRGVSRVVYMGMGEPLLNYDATMQSIRILHDERGIGLGARSFTVSTAGIAPAVDRLAEEGLQVNLAISLHAADDQTRDLLVPINRRYPIASLLAATRRYIEKTNRRVTFEVALIDGVNDSDSKADAVASLLSGLLCHVNLIPYNETPDSAARPSPPERVRAFVERLERRGLPVTVRNSLGTDIRAGCGQLRARKSEEASRDRPASGRRPTP
jgi:23S rRNA (adenine2503-C2)-methyltransferase